MGALGDPAAFSAQQCQEQGWRKPERAQTITAPSPAAPEGSAVPIAISHGLAQMRSPHSFSCSFPGGLRAAWQFPEV